MSELQTHDHNKGRVLRHKLRNNTDIPVIDLVLHIVNLLVDSGVLVPDSCKDLLENLRARLDLRSAIEASLLAVLMNLSNDSRIRSKDLAKFYGVPTLLIVKHMDELDDLVRRRIIVRHRDNEETTFRIGETVLRDLSQGHLPQPKDVSGLSLNEFWDEVSSLLEQYKEGELDDDLLEESLRHLMLSNRQQQVVQKVIKLDLSYSNAFLLLVFASIYRNDNDDNIGRYDLIRYFSRIDLSEHTRLLELGEHELMSYGLIEYSPNDGRVDPSVWKLTEDAKYMLFGKNLASKKDQSLLSYENISKKKMYYNNSVSSEVELLKSLLKPRRMTEVVKQLEARGLRKGFTCLFYGAPGTGKTETVLQLARETKRDVLIVDVPSIRSKWVGETETNIKAVFTRYRYLVRQSRQAPILVFNEADAVLGVRKEGASNSVDKMENAMQNIILQEMEQLEGIMIATTNLTGSLDAAFERRFLYKVEFEKPTPAERLHIWQSMLPDLSKAAAQELAEEYDFSGGQIENVARKRIVSDIIANRNGLDLASIKQNCASELLHKNNRKAIGFR